MRRWLYIAAILAELPKDEPVVSSAFFVRKEVRNGNGRCKFASRSDEKEEYSKWVIKFLKR
jgi:hypothetical protein